MVAVKTDSITLKDIAAASGYSTVSVHRAIHNKDGVSRKAKEKILEVANEMGYTTNYVASALKRRRINLAVILPEAKRSGKYYFHYIWKGCERAMEEVSGYHINTLRYTFCNKNAEGSSEQIEILKELYRDWGDRLDGILTTPASDNSQLQCLLSQFSGKGVAVVLIDNDFKDCGRLCCVAPNDIYTGRLAAELMSLAIKGKEGTILVAQGDERSLSHKMNVEGFTEYFAQQEAGVRISCVKDMDDPEKNKKQLLDCLIRDDTIIGAYTARARITIPLCEAVLESGKKEEIITVGSDLFPESAEMLRNGVLKAIVYKNPYRKGYVGYLTLFEYLIKGKIPKGEAISVNISIILQNNIRFFEEDIF